MKLDEAKEQFVQAWGTLATNWGINRTMAQVHALLLISAQAQGTEEIMEQLRISRGNANMNLRELINWGLIYKEFKTGERREFFRAEKDIYKVFTQVVKERRRRELEPIFKVLDDVRHVEGDANDAEVKAFTDTIKNLQSFASKADSVLVTVSKADENWFFSSILKLLK